MCVIISAKASMAIIPITGYAIHNARTPTVSVSVNSNDVIFLKFNRVKRCIIMEIEGTRQRGYQKKT